MEFDSGEESVITLEYEKLEMYCSICTSLLHSWKNCPEKVRENSVKTTTRPLTETNYDRKEAMKA